MATPLPAPKLIDPQYNIDALDSVAMSEAERQRVYSGTAREFLGLKS